MGTADCQRNRVDAGQDDLHGTGILYGMGPH